MQGEVRRRLRSGVWVGCRRDALERQGFKRFQHDLGFHGLFGRWLDSVSVLFHSLQFRSEWPVRLIRSF